MTNKPNWLQLLICSFLIFTTTPANAQITPDNTLGAQNSRLTPNVLINGASADRIDGGEVRGSNLFHSFTQFNINNGQRVYFSNPVGVENILTRVTGKEASNIFGILGVNGAANLFLINPNGILFGKNAQLDIRGSFLGTTANAIQFGNQGIFSATNPTAPPLLTINPSALLFNQINQSQIINRSRQIATPGSFYLIGGDITFDGGIAFSIGNRLELGAVAGTGNVELIDSGNQMQLAFPEGLPKGDIVLQNNAFALTTGGGAISVNAQNLNILGNSFINATLAAGEGTPNISTGNIVVNASGDVTLDNLSNIVSLGSENSLGDTGNVTINAQSIRLTNQSQVGSNGPLNRGNIILNANNNVSLDSNSFINTNGSLNSVGKSGDITIVTRNINLSNQSGINSANVGIGQSGKITLKAQEAISLNSGSNILSASTASAFGQEVNSQPSGDIEIKTRNLTLNGNNTLISASNIDQGRGGNIRIVADDSILLNSSNINSATIGKGDGGNIQLETRELKLVNGGSIGTVSTGSGSSGNLLINASESVTLSGITTFIAPQTGETNSIGSILATSVNGAGNSGRLTINTQRLSVTDGGYINTSTESGHGGDLTINAKEFMEVVGSSPNIPSIISTSTFGSGDAGSLNISAGRLSIRNRGIVTTSTFSTGKGGNLTVNTTGKVELIGTSADGSRNTIVSTSALPGSTGNAGDLTINAQDLFVQDRAQINASTFGAGKAGNLTVNASESVQLIGKSANNEFSTGLFASAEKDSTGNAGDLKVKTQNLLVRDGAQVSVTTLGTGNAGIMTINADSIRLDNQASFNANTRSPNKDSNREQATINFNSPLLILRRGSNITTNATGENVIGGNINIGTDFLIALQNSDISANSTDFRGGRVRITGLDIFGTQPRNALTPESDITATGASPQLSGSTEINTPDLDRTQGLIELPFQVIDASNQIAQDCPRSRNAKKPLGNFIVTGRGIPPNATQPLNGTPNLPQLATLDSQNASTKPNTSSIPKLPPTSQNTIIEAQGWVKTPDGEIMLVAQVPTAPTATTTSAACPVSR